MVSSVGTSGTDVKKTLTSPAHNGLVKKVAVVGAFNRKS